MIPFIDLSQQYLEAKEDIDASISKVIASSNFITGSLTEEFEDKLKEYIQAEEVAAVQSGTVALLTALLACDIKAGDEVITTPHTFISTSESIHWTGAKPVYVDIDEYYHIDVDKIEQHITSKTKAILFVDLYGQTPNIERLRQIADKHNLYLIEDAAQSFGSSYQNKPVGGLDVDLTCMSFNPLKNLGAFGNAGAVSGKKHLIDKVKQYRDHGRKGRFDFDLLGVNGRIDNIQAGVVLAKLPYLKGWIERKRNVCRYYTEHLKDYCITPKETPWSYHSYYVYVIQIPNRDEYIKYMQEHGITCNIHYPKSLTQQPLYGNSYNSCLTTEDVCSKIVSLPCYHNLTKESQDIIIELTKHWICNALY
jgi:dTDP-4-amino-4,6-dideoxygalactose transaminase